ncbi:MAG: TetR/AcrR family transcriptional regulator [Desulfuromonadales bacterium]|nr:TetR/AcrR family transcriptional regulator [Desulfuromonadales bacterium]MBN2790917.1 TetR/AcrR family transcriptional regulator [Desulfuromonadales bacterium]
MNVNYNSPDTEGLSQRLATGIRREQIIAAALKLISENGPAALNIADIADQIGLVPSAIYRHFPGKKEILLAVNGLIKDRLLANIHKACQGTDEPLTQLHRLLLLHVEVALRTDGIARYVFTTGALAKGSQRKLELFEGVRLYLNRVAEIFASGQQKGQIQKGQNPDTLAFMFLGLIQPAIFLHQLGDAYYDIETQVESAWQIFIKGISTVK